MITRDDVPRVVGRNLVDAQGDKVGDIDTVYLDDETDEPEFALVSTGLFGRRSSLVPLQDAGLEAETVRVPYSKDQIRDAPDVDPDEHIELDQEEELYRHYGIHGATDRPETAERGPVGRDVSGPTTDDAMTRSEEELHVGTTRREAGRVRLRKYVVTEHVTQTVPVQREEVRVEREPIGEENVRAAHQGPAISDEEHEMTLTEEEPVVEKRTVPKERVRLDKDVVSEERRVEDDVRREEIDVDEHHDR